MAKMSEHTRARLSLARAEKRAFRQAVRDGGRLYRRSRDLQRILTPGDDWLASPEIVLSSHEIRCALLKALRAMIRARYQGTWHYSQPRHLAILQALAGELRMAGNTNVEDKADNTNADKNKTCRDYTATAPPSGVDGSIEPVARPSLTDIPLGSA